MGDETQRLNLAELQLEPIAAGLMRHGWMLSSAESCTGGWIAKSATDRAGSSAWFNSALVTYSNQAKASLLGVDPSLIEIFGAVSEPVVEAMVSGCHQATASDICVAVSGVAGPGGGSPDKPVGTVWFAWLFPSDGQNHFVETSCHQFSGDRDQVRWQTVLEAYLGIERFLTSLD